MWPFSCGCDHKKYKKYNVGKTTLSLYNSKNKLIGTKTITGSGFDAGEWGISISNSKEISANYIETYQFYVLDSGERINRNVVAKITTIHEDLFKDYEDV